jgi:transposase-like protein
MKGHGTKFGRKKEAAIAALLTQRNLEEAARSIGVAPNTLLNWMKVPAFQAAFRDARRQAYSQAVAKLQHGATAAATTLLKIMVDAITPAAVRVRAAECILNHSSKAIEIDDVAARVAELERSLNNEPESDRSFGYVKR